MPGRSIFLASICLAGILCGEQSSTSQAVPSLESISPSKMLETARAQTEWDRGNVISVEMREKNADITYVYEIKDANNILISGRGKIAAESMDGQMMLIDGRWMLAKGMPLVKGYEIDDLDLALIELKLALSLLSNIAPSGPAEIKARSNFKLKDQKNRFVVATLSANAAIEAPWSLNATIEPVAGNKCSFDLNLKAHPSMHFAGAWQKEPSLHALDDDVPLTEWQIYAIGVAATQQKRGMVYDIVAKPSDLHPKTLGELRRLTKN